MTTTIPEPKIGQPIQWLDVMAHYGERPRRGEVWSVAPNVPGRGRGFWVIPTDGDNLEALYVVWSTTRHRCGYIGASGHRYRKDKGRYVDKGEAYREVSRFAIVNEARYVTARPGTISGAPVGARAETELNIYLATIEAAQRPVDGAPEGPAALSRRLGAEIDQRAAESRTAALAAWDVPDA
jgi:hypothetical protein